MKWSESEIRVKVLNLISKLGEATFDESRECLEDEGYYINPVLLREIIAYMLKEGTIVKVEKPEKMKFVLRLSGNLTRL